MKRLYVVVRSDLCPSQQAVQSGHALAEFLLKRDTTWPNGTLIYLTVPDRESMNLLCYRLSLRDVDFVTFREPNINREITAIASLGTNSLFRKLPML